MTLPPATRTRAKQAWESSLAGMTPDPEEAARLAFSTPVLLRPDVLDYLEREQNVSATEPGQLLASMLRRAQRQISEAPETYRIGGGPVEALWAKVESGDLSVAQARTAAKGLPITETLTPAYVQQLLWNLLPLAAKPATWRQARTRGELVRAAAEACDRRDEPAFRLGYCRGVVHWAHGLLISVPDNALLQEATTLGEEALAAAQDDKQAVNGANYELAALWSDPYCAGRSSTDYGTDIQAWKRRGHTELTRVDGRDEKDYEMPATVTALTEAMAYWRAARDACPDNVPTLAGFAETSTWMAQLTGQPLPEDAADAIRHGIELAGMDPAQLAMKTRLLMLAAATKTTVEPTSALATADPDALVRRYEGRAGTMVLQETIGLSSSAPKLALSILERQRELLLGPGQLDDSDFQILYQTAARVLYNAIGAPGELEPLAGHDFTEFAAEVVSRLGPEPGPERLAATLLWLALLSTGIGAESRGLQLLTVLRREAPLFARRYDWIVRAAEASLLSNVGVNAYRGDDVPGALRALMASLGAWLQQERLEPVREMLARLADLATGADEQVAMELVASIISVAPAIAAKLGRAADDYLARIFSGLLGALVGAGRDNSELLWTMLQFAKGLRTAMVLDRTARISMRRDSDAAGILDRIAARPPDAPAPLSLYRQFESRRQQLLLGGLSAPALLDLEQARRALDHRTVLVSTMSIAYRDGSVARVAGIFWDEDQIFTYTRPLRPDTPPAEVPWLPTPVQGVLADRAGEGRDHLCIIPDMGLHRAPWHLYGWDDTMLADDWIVTLLPHPHLLFAGRGAPTVVGRQTLPVLAVGVTHSDAVPDLPPLSDAPAEAQAIADKLHGRALLDPDATEQMIARLAPGARYLHIGCHGRFEPTAPSFHALLVQPHEGDDGVLCAWEVAEMDLRTVRLVTLSACETAKMVVESGANVDGLPIAFLTAGARAVIGSQLEIETATSRYFFEQLYGALAGVDDLRDAFRAAQTATRRRFPDPDRWAAFYLLGDWR